MSNLVKGSFTSVKKKNVRVLDMNELAAKRIEEQNRRAAAEKQAPKGSFVSGLTAEAVSVSDEGDASEELTQEQADGLFADPEEILEENGSFVPEDISPEAILAAAMNRSEEILSEARVQAESILAEAKFQIEQERQTALQQAKEEGYRESRAVAQQEVADQKAALEEERRQMEETYQNALNMMEPGIVDTVCTIYEFMFGHGLRACQDILVHLAGNAIRGIENSGTYLVHVSTEDYEGVAEQKFVLESSALIPGSIVELIEDRTLSQGQCFIETDGGIFDCGIDTELKELSQKIRLLSYQTGQE